MRAYWEATLALKLLVAVEITDWKAAIEKMTFLEIIKEMTGSLAWKEKQIPLIVALEQIPRLTLMQLNETLKLEIVRTSGKE
jgi:hypothetical protein